MSGSGRAKEKAFTAKTQRSQRKALRGKSQNLFHHKDTKGTKERHFWVKAKDGFTAKAQRKNTFLLKAKPILPQRTQRSRRKALLGKSKKVIHQLQTNIRGLCYLLFPIFYFPTWEDAEKGQFGLKAKAKTLQSSAFSSFRHLSSVTQSSGFSPSSVLCPPASPHFLYIRCCASTCGIRNTRSSSGLASSASR